MIATSSPDTARVRAAEPHLAAALSRFLTRAAGHAAMAVSAAYRRALRAQAVAKADAPPPELEAILAAAGIPWEQLPEIVKDALEQVYADAGSEAYGSLSVTEATMFDRLNEAALAYAQDRGAELVGMTYDAAGNLVPNPDAEWSIAESTRDALKQLIEDAFTEGLTPAELAASIRDATMFSADRASMVSRTELALAQVQGTLSAWRESGMVQGKRSILASNHDQDDECDLNAAAGAIPLDEPFPSGDDGPPFHPNCLCDTVAELVPDDRASAAA